MRAGAIILLIFLFFLLSGCTKKFSEDSLNYDLMNLRSEAVQVCRGKGMEYLALETINYNNYQVLCKTSSPMKIYKFKVEL